MKKLFALALCLALCVSGVYAEEMPAENVEMITTIAVAQTLQLTLEETPAENAEIAWSTSDAAIVSVDENGLVTALNVGEAVVTATATIAAEAPEAAADDAAAEAQKPETLQFSFDLVVEAALCPGCGAEYSAAEEFNAHVQIAVCGEEGHYVCDGRDHETILDEFCPNEENPHRVCMAGVATHVCESCGKTYACEDSGSHTTCIACGNSWCYKDDGDHVTPNCGKIEHRPCMLKHFNSSEHRRCRHCNALRCNGAKHGVGKCVPAPAPEAPAPEAPVE